MVCAACFMRNRLQGVNGSGKHNNWSLTTDDGINLLEPGKLLMRISSSFLFSPVS